MAARLDQAERVPRAALERAGAALEALAEASAGVASAQSLAEALAAIAEPAARAAGADVVVIRVVDDRRQDLIACAVASESKAVAAELEGTRVPTSSTIFPAPSLARHVMCVPTRSCNSRSSSPTSFRGASS